MTLRFVTTAFLTAVLVAVWSGCRPSVAPEDWSVAIQPMTSPAGESSTGVQLTTSSEGVLMSWIERSAGDSATLRFAERAGAGWSPVRTVASGRDWFLSYADVPSVLRLSDGTLAASWLQTIDARLEAYDLHLSYSTDDGRTWASSFLPHHDNTTSQHGFASLIELPDRGLGVIWLDGRDIATTTADDGGNMAVWFAAFDKQWAQTPEIEVHPRVCECCPTSAVLTADGPLAAFRARSADEIRDIYVSRFENGSWTTATPVHNDRWEIFACPVNGPSLSARGRDAVAAWFTVRDDHGQAWASFSGDAGRTWGDPVRLDDGESIGRVDVEMLDDGSAVASWIEFTKDHSQFRLRRIDRSGARSPSVGITRDGVTPSGYPRMARAGSELVLAWIEGNSVKVAVATLP
jgi:hypothetical protein